jgi:hypothetical protein
MFSLVGASTPPSTSIMSRYLHRSHRFVTRRPEPGLTCVERVEVGAVAVAFTRGSVIFSGLGAAQASRCCVHQRAFDSHDALARIFEPRTP